MAPKKNGGYKPTSLPPLLDLSNKNTRNQLDDRYAKRQETKKESEDACRDVMKDDLIQWIEKDIGKLNLLHEISPAGDVQGFWMWLRHFHKEYNDDWFTRNMPRLKEQFEPVYKRTLKALRGEANVGEAATTKPKEPADLLDLGEQTSAPAVSSSISNDLIDIGAVSSTAPPPTTSSTCLDDMLLQLDENPPASTSPLSVTQANANAGGQQQQQQPPPPPPPPPPLLVDNLGTDNSLLGTLCNPTSGSGGSGSKPPPPPPPANGPVKRPETSLLDELGFDFSPSTETSTCNVNKAPVVPAAAPASPSTLNLLDLNI